jgi:magnesium and cobalt transporter
MKSDRRLKKDWLTRVLALFQKRSKEQHPLLGPIKLAAEHGDIDTETLSMLEGALSFSNLTAKDVLIPRSRMDVIHFDEPIEQQLLAIIDTAHSRFPVIGDDKDDVQGIILAKDLLRYFQAPSTFDLKDFLRPAIFIPESKPLNLLLKDFKKTHNHMAIVVNEYGGVSGLVTIEDVIEQIIGEIEDEHDIGDADDFIVSMPGGRFRLKASTEIIDFNEYFDADFDDEHADTLGGFLLEQFGRVPQRGEKIMIGRFEFTVLRADSRRLHAVVMTQRAHALTEHAL